jgi:hypothetical protein
MFELIAEGWPDITTSDWRPDTLPEFVVAMRNAVSHWNVTFKAKPSHEIYELVMHSTVKGRNQWRGRMSVGVLEDVARRVAAEFVRDFAAAA